MKKFLIIVEICIFLGIVFKIVNVKRNAKAHENEKKFSWENYNTITHALGGLEGYTYLNAKEGFQEYYEKGSRLFELDLKKTSDKVWVCRHNWQEALGQWDGEEKNVLSSKEFCSIPIYGKYTPMTLEDALQLLEAHPDAYYLIDCKNYSKRDYENTLADYQAYYEAAKNAGVEQVMDQIIPEIYNSSMYDAISTIYPFPSYIYSLWKKYEAKELKEIADFCAEKEIPAVCVSRSYWSEEIQKIFDEKHILVYIYTVNDNEEANSYIEKGAAGVCTDVLLPENLNKRKD